MGGEGQDEGTGCLTAWVEEVEDQDSCVALTIRQNVQGLNAVNESMLLGERDYAQHKKY